MVAKSTKIISYYVDVEAKHEGRTIMSSLASGEEVSLLGQRQHIGLKVPISKAQSCSYIAAPAQTENRLIEEADRVSRINALLLPS